MVFGLDGGGCIWSVLGVSEGSHGSRWISGGFLFRSFIVLGVECGFCLCPSFGCLLLWFCLFSFILFCVGHGWPLLCFGGLRISGPRGWLWCLGMCFFSLVR